MNSRQKDRLEADVKRAKEQAAEAARAYESAHDQAFPEEKAERDWIERSAEEADADDFDMLKHLDKARQRATSEVAAAEGRLSQAMHDDKLDRSRRSLHQTAEADDKVRDEHAHKVRVRINQTGAAIIATSVGILVARPVSEQAQIFLVGAIHAAAYSGALFVVEWIAGMVWSHVVARNRTSAAKRLTDPERSLPAFGRLRDVTMRNAPWILTLLQTGLVAVSGVLFVSGVVEIARTLRGAVS